MYDKATTKVKEGNSGRQYRPVSLNEGRGTAHMTFDRTEWRKQG
jgi:hypothetical protein